MRSANNVKDEDSKFFSTFYFHNGCSVDDARIANCEVQYTDHEFKLCNHQVTVKLPMCVNTKKLESGAEIKMLSADKIETQAAKKRKVQ